jgi:N-acetylglucosamine malate deacetylase 1
MSAATGGTMGGTMDALFFGAHPDDVELTSAGLAARLAQHGHAVAIVDLTRGEAASRGTVAERAEEAAAAGRELGVALRENLELPDLGIDRSDRGQLAAIVSCVRRHRPKLVVAPHADDAHPDHVEAASLIARACYVSGLARVGQGAPRHRPVRLLHVHYRTAVPPRLIVDVTEVWERRMRALACHRSQLDPAAGPSTYLTSPTFLAEVEGRARAWGALIGVAFGEAYGSRLPLGVFDARSLLAHPPEAPR